MGDVISILFWAVVWGIVAEFIAKKRGVRKGFLWGLLLGIIGIIVVCLLPVKKDAGAAEDNDTN